MNQWRATWRGSNEAAKAKEKGTRLSCVQDVRGCCHALTPTPGFGFSFQNHFETKAVTNGKSGKFENLRKLGRNEFKHLRLST
jgi:hypothetical protein